MVAPSQHLIRETASHRDEQRPLKDHISVLATISAVPAPIHIYLSIAHWKDSNWVDIKYDLHINCLKSDQSLIKSCWVRLSAIYPATPLPASSATAKSLNPMIFVHGNYILVEYFTEEYIVKSPFFSCQCQSKINFLQFQQDPPQEEIVLTWTQTWSVELLGSLLSTLYTLAPRWDDRIWVKQSKVDTAHGISARVRDGMRGTFCQLCCSLKGNWAKAISAVVARRSLWEDEVLLCISGEPAGRLDPHWQTTHLVQPGIVDHIFMWIS